MFIHLGKGRIKKSNKNGKMKNLQLHQPTKYHIKQYETIILYELYNSGDY